MTQNHIDTFDEDIMHLWIPEFAKEGTDGEKLWLTFCFALSQIGGPQTRYEFYSKDMNRVLGTNWSSSELCNILNRKYGKYIKFTTIDARISYMWWIETDFEWSEWFVTKPLTQRIWIHLFNQFWGRTGFKSSIFDRSTEPLSTWARSWSDAGHGTFKHNCTIRKVDHLLKGQDWHPNYLSPKLGGTYNSPGGRQAKYI